MKADAGTLNNTWIFSLIQFFNENAGAVSVLLSALSLLIAILAVWSTLYVVRKQTNLQLFEERYKIFSRFSILLSAMEIVSHKSLTPKGRLFYWNVQDAAFDLSESESSRLGAQINQYNKELLQTDLDEEQRTKINELREKAVAEKFFMDYRRMLADVELLSKSELLFPADVAENISEFLSIYQDLVFKANYSREEELEDDFKKLSEWYSKPETEKVISRMKAYLSYKR